MLSSNDFWGFGSLEGFVRFMLYNGCTVTEVADALETKVAYIAAQCPTLDIYSYPICERLGGKFWDNEECKILFDHYTDNGPNWDGWRSLLPKRTRGAIEGMARRLGIPH